MPADVQQEIFNPFFTTKAAGTGLGLPISLRIVEEHGGALEASSRLGEGTVFRVWLPLATDEREEQ
jgi:signal transduction histidine kinase